MKLLKTKIPVDKQLQFFEKVKPMDPNVFAKKTLKAIVNNKGIIIFPSWTRIFWWIDRISPALSAKLGKSVYKEFVEMCINNVKEKQNI